MSKLWHSVPPQSRVRSRFRHGCRGLLTWGRDIGKMAEGNKKI